MMTDLDKLKEQIMNASNGGLEIFYRLYPNASTKRNFSIRTDDDTPSSSLHQAKEDGVWTITDFGNGAQKTMNAITAYAQEKHLKYKEALYEIAKQYNIPTTENVTPAKPTFKEYPLGNAPFELDEKTGYYFDITDEFTEAEYKFLGAYVDKETCQKCNCYKVISMASEVTDDTTGAKKILQRFSNESYPIFAFINTYEGKTFYKIYQPKSEKKKYKFLFVGGRPKGFINGLDRLIKTYQVEHQKWLERSIEDEPEPEKIDQVIICSGERDALNMTSLGYFVVWHNSETAKWEKHQIKKLYDNAKKIINIPDIDDTGIREGRDLAEHYLTVHTFWLPNSIVSQGY